MERGVQRGVLYVGHVLVKKGEVMFYIAQYPVRWTAQSALNVLPSLADLFIPRPTRLLREAFKTYCKSTMDVAFTFVLPHVEQIPVGAVDGTSTMAAAGLDQLQLVQY